jgi:hypothetical protein
MTVEITFKDGRVQTIGVPDSWGKEFVDDVRSREDVKEVKIV